MPARPTPSGGRAVFLSYAHEDMDAARRIADALRAFGVQAWLDQSELRGGDAWDAKIKKQIRECALFAPIVSAHTQARGEGYFRREWKLAVDRTHDMAHGIPFIVPIVLDETRESDAIVPDEFVTVQWMRLPVGVASPEFVAQIKQLLDEPPMPVPLPELDNAGSKPPGAARQRSRRSRVWIWRAVALLVSVGAIAYIVSPRSPSFGAARGGAMAQGGAAGAPISEARKLADRARALQEDYAQDDTLRDNLMLADQLCKRALELDPFDGDGWAIAARVSLSLTNFDNTTARMEVARGQAQRAMQLAPRSPESRLAMADYLRKQSPATRPEAEEILRGILRENPNDARVLRMLAMTLQGMGRTDEALVYFDRAAALPGGDGKALISRATILFNQQRYAEAEAAVNDSMAVRPTAAARLLKIQFMLIRGELAGARTLLEQVPASSLVDDRGAYVASRVWLWSREPEKALAVLRAAPRDYFDDLRSLGGPKAFLAGQAHQQAGRMEAAQAEWRNALRVVDQRLTTSPNDPRLLGWRALLLAELGEQAGAERMFRLFEQLAPAEQQRLDTVRLLVALGRMDEALIQLRPLVDSARGSSLRSMLRYDSFWDRLRGDTRFAALINEPAKEK